jgi:outer membrane biosynthesis protein TonB
MKKKEKPAKKVAPAKKAAPKKAEAKKPAKKVEAKKAAPAKKAPAKKPAAKKEEVNYRTYHLVKRSDGKWEVKFAGGQKAIKLFDTQKEALEYSKKMAKNQDGSVLVHNSKGINKGRIQKKR